MDTKLWKTGDLLAFSGFGLYDTLIKWWTHSKYTHVGMLDMTIPSSPILIQSTPAHGVAPMEVARAIQEEGGKVFWVAVNEESALTRNIFYKADLLAFMVKTYGNGYNWQGIARFLFPFIKRIKSRQFCSELVAEAFQFAKLMTETFESPGQLIANPIFKEAVPL